MKSLARLLAFLTAFASASAAEPGARDFSGVWETTYGPMRLVQKGDRAEGCYAYEGGSTIAGTVKDGSFAFTYREPDGVTGKGEFKLATGRAGFTGTWQADSGGQPEAWEGTKVEPQPGRIWLVVLEARWEQSLREPDYSYGEMLRQFFTRVPAVAVRHRFFTGRADFAQWCAELPYLTEPVVLYVSSHADKKGITVGREILDGKFIGEQLRQAPGVMLVHLGACLALSGTVPDDIRQACGRSVPVSGFTREADWAGSAIIDFAYLNLILERSMPPGEAVKQVRDNLTFARDQALPDSAIAPAGLKIVE